LFAGTRSFAGALQLVRVKDEIMGHYEIRIQKPDGSPALSWKVEQADDMSALSSALEMCKNQKVEVWEGHRRIASISLSGQPRLTL
jgi:hypothetical protein